MAQINHGMDNIEDLGILSPGPKAQEFTQNTGSNEPVSKMAIKIKSPFLKGWLSLSRRNQPLVRDELYLVLGIDKNKFYRLLNGKSWITEETKQIIVNVFQKYGVDDVF